MVFVAEEEIDAIVMVLVVALKVLVLAVVLIAENKVLVA